VGRDERAAQDFVAVGRVWSSGRRPWRSMRRKKRRARWGRSFWAKAEMTELHVVADLWGKESKSLCEE